MRPRYRAICCGVQRHSRIGIAREPARARVHRADEHEPGREVDSPCRARDRHVSFLERLAQDFEHAAMKLQHLVEKQDAVVGEAHLARARLRLRRQPAPRSKSCDAARETADPRRARSRSAAGPPPSERP